MALENVIEAVLSVNYLFGAATALAFRKQMSALFGSVFERASGESDNDEQA